MSSKVPHTMYNNLCCQTLFDASARGHNNCLLNLLDHGFCGKHVNINKKDHRGCTALHIAVCGHRVNIVKTLLDQGCDHMLLNNGNQTAKDCVIEILDNKFWEDAYDYADYADIKELLLNHDKNLTDLNNTKLI